MAKRELTPAQLRQRQQAPLKHGIHAKSESAVKIRWRVVRHLVNRMHQAMPWLQASDEPTCRAWAELEYVCAEIFVLLRKEGLINPGTNEPRRLLSEYRAMRATQLQYARELGMTPAARAALGLTVAQGQHADLASELAALRLAKVQGHGHPPTPPQDRSADES